MRDTHEYLADSGVLMDSANSSSYQSLLLSQITGSLPMVITSSFNSTLKNRIKMMCKNKSSLLAKYKPLLIVPVLTGLVLLFACEEKPADPLEEEYAFDEIAPEADASAAVEEEEVFFIVEEMPTFKGDDPAIEFRKYIAQNLQYPEIASANGISGRVIIQAEDGIYSQPIQHIHTVSTEKSQGSASELFSLGSVVITLPQTPEIQRKLKADRST